MTATRRGVLALGLAGLAGPAPAIADEATDAAPEAADTEAWAAYEARLRARIDDAGGGRVDEAAARAVLALTNRARAQAGAPPLAWHDELASTARAHAGDLAQRDYVEHLSPEGFDPSHRFWLIGRTTIGSPSENIAYHRGPAAAPPALFQRWRQSPGHWQNLLRPSHTHAAYAWVTRADRTWLVGLYAHPLASLSEPLPFRARGPEVRRALQALPAEHRPRLGVPQGSRLGKVAGRLPVMQITAVRTTDPGRYEVIGGPIFLATEAG